MVFFILENSVLVINIHSTDTFLIHSCIISESKPGCNQKEAITSRDHGSCHFAESDTDDVLNVSDNDPDPDLCWWIKALTLYEDDKEILLGNMELTDNCCTVFAECSVSAYCWFPTHHIGL